jgi:hypothetical protein
MSTSYGCQLYTVPENFTPYIYQKPVLKITLYYLMRRVLIEVWSLGVNTNTENTSKYGAITSHHILPNSCCMC